MCSSTLSLTSVLDVVVWLTPRPGRFTPGTETRYPFYRRLCGSKDPSGRVRKISVHWNSIQGLPSLQRVAVPTELSRPKEGRITGIKVLFSVTLPTANTQQPPWARKLTPAVTHCLTYDPDYFQNSLPPSPHLQHPFRESCLLSQLLEVFGVRILVDGEV